MKQTIKKQIRIPFTLEALKNPNAQFVLRDGTPVDKSTLRYLPEYYEHYSICAMFGEEMELWTKEGKYLVQNYESPKDLLEVIQVEEVIEKVMRVDFNEEEVLHLLLMMQSAQDSFGDKKILPEDSSIKKSYNDKLQSWIEKGDALQKKILLHRWTELPTPPDSYYINQNK